VGFEQPLPSSTTGTPSPMVSAFRKSSCVLWDLRVALLPAQPHPWLTLTYAVRYAGRRTRTVFPECCGDFAYSVRLEATGPFDLLLS
jgi:hypothetical protein